MTSPFRTTLALIASITLITMIASCSSNNSDEERTAPAQTSATAIPTVTQIPTATNTPGPTPTPKPTATPSPTPIATSTPPPPNSYVNEMGRLFTEYDIDFSTLFVQSVGAAQWPSTALGCPEPGTFADTSEAPYDGFYYLISNGSRTWEYHANADDSVVVRCDERTPSNAPLINITEQASLADSTKLTLMRRDFSTGNFEVRREMTPADMERVIALFDQNSGISYNPPCTTVFRLDFVTNDGTSEIEVVCEENYQAFDIYWNELHGTAPTLGYIIGPYLTGDPIPQLPTETP